MPTNETMTFRISAEQREALKVVAERERRSLAWMVAEYVRQGLERDQAAVASKTKQG